MTIRNNKGGFTLIELLIAMAISTVVMTAIYSAFQAQLKSHVTQQKVVEMHQNARAAMFVMEREIKMSGYDPLESDVPKITSARINFIEFTMDTTGGEADGLDNDGDGLTDEADENADKQTDDALEQIRYFISNDADNDGIADSLDCNLQRQYWDGADWQPNLATDPTDADIALDIDALNFVYLDANGDDLIDYALTPPQVPAALLDDIRSVQISIVARAGQNERQGLPGKKLDTTVYMNQQDRPGDDWDIILPAPNDRFRRVILTSDVKCRNLGLN